MSVVVPVFNDTARLRRCLEALARQTYPEDRYEVIVIDNGSEEDVAAVCRPHSRVRYAMEQRVGAYAARNHGMSLAQGEILAFTDADCVPDQDWLRYGVRRFVAIPNCGFLAGRIDVFAQDPHRPTAVERYELVSAFPQKGYVTKAKFGVTANLFTSRSVIAAVGGFDDHLKSGGDFEWCRRAVGQGRVPAYADDVRVYHPARSTWTELRRKVRRTAGGQYGLDPRLSASLLCMLRDAVPPVHRMAPILLSRSGRVQDRILVVLMILVVRYLTVWEHLRLQVLPGNGTERS